jgi:tRNA1(Val) A37 N6-methylase TrmN6
MLLSKKVYKDWWEIQDEYYEHYKANLTFSSYEDIIQFFTDDFKEEENWPFSRDEIINFSKSADVVIKENIK